MPDQKFLKYVERLYQRFQQHDAKQTDRLDKFRNIEPESAHFLSMLVQLQQPQSILEIGTSTGYSTLWLARTAQSINAHLTTLEIEKDRTEQAQQHVNNLNLNNAVTFWVGDAGQYLAQCEKQFDFILLDAERQYYLKYWHDLKRILRKKGGVLMVDNVLSHAQEVADFLNEIQSDTNFEMTTLAVGAGLCMVIAN